MEGRQDSDDADQFALAPAISQAKGTDPNLIIDTTVMKRIEQSGFIRALYKK